MPGFPRLYAAASLKRLHGPPELDELEWFSAALCRGLIEARWTARSGSRVAPFSAALCRGLIEASRRWPGMVRPVSPFSAALCRGLIEALYSRTKSHTHCVFRGSMPRPH